MARKRTTIVASIGTAIVLLCGIILISKGNWLSDKKFSFLDYSPKENSSTISEEAAMDPASPVLTETINFGFWFLTCRSNVGKKSKKTCSAELKIIDNDRQSTLFIWIIGLNMQGALYSVFQTPTGLDLAKGAHLKFDAGSTRTIPFSICEAQHCEVSAEMNRAFVDEAKKATEATVIVTTADGRQINFAIHLNGIGNVLSEISP